MKLEAVDRKKLSDICVSTIAAAVDNRLLIHIDHCDDTHDYWWDVCRIAELMKGSVSACGVEYVLFVLRCDASSPYIHPVGYCEEAKLTLTTPAG